MQVLESEADVGASEDLVDSYESKAAADQLSLQEAEEERDEAQGKLLEVEMEVSTAGVDIANDFGEEATDDLKGVRREVSRRGALQILVTSQLAANTHSLQLEKLVASEDTHRSYIEALEADLTTLQR